MPYLYEAVYILDSHLSDEAVEETVKRIEEFIKTNGGTLQELNRWGKRRMSYEIKKKQHGLYYHFLFETRDGVLPNQLNAHINPKLVESVLRHLIIRVDPRQLAADARRREAEALAAAAAQIVQGDAPVAVLAGAGASADSAMLSDKVGVVDLADVDGGEPDIDDAAGTFNDSDAAGKPDAE